MKFDTLEVALQLAAALAAPVAKIARCDRDLASQLRRAANGIALQVAEARKREGGDRLHLFRVAAGSNSETVVALRLALGWGYVEAGEVAEPLALADRLGAMLWRLAHPRPRG